MYILFISGLCTEAVAAAAAVGREMLKIKIALSAEFTIVLHAFAYSASERESYF